MTDSRRFFVGGLHVAIDGAAEDAPWVVFSNSLATDLSLWDPQVSALVGRYRVLRYDYHGHGASAPADDPVLATDALVRDLLAVMDAAGVVRAHHVGTSMGALAGIAATSAAPGRFASLVIGNARLRSSTASAASLGERAGRARALGMHALTNMTLEKWFAHSSPPVAQALRSRIGAMISAVDAASFAAYADGSREYELETALARLNLSVQFIAGSRDGDVAEAFGHTAARLRNAQVARIDGAGHLPNVEAPDRFNHVLLDFLAAIDATQS